MNGIDAAGAPARGDRFHRATGRATPTASDGVRFSPTHCIHVVIRLDRRRSE